MKFTKIIFAWHRRTLGYIKEDILKEDTHSRETTPHPSLLPLEIELALTIRFLASGNSYQDLSMCFCVHKSTIAKFIPEACQSNYARLKDTYLKVRNFHY